MYKKGVVYEKNFYYKKTTMRLKSIFTDINMIIKKSDYEEVIKELKEPEKECLKLLKQVREEWLDKEEVYIPEKAKEYIIFATYFQICKGVLETIENNEIEKTNFDFVFRVGVKVMKIMHTRFRKELNDYGYIIKKEKKTNHLRKRKRK